MNKRRLVNKLGKEIAEKHQHKKAPWCRHGMKMWQAGCRRAYQKFVNLTKHHPSLGLQWQFPCAKCASKFVRKEHLSLHVCTFYTLNNVGGIRSKNIDPHLKPRRKAPIMREKSNGIACIIFRKRGTAALQDHKAAAVPPLAHNTKMPEKRGGKAREQEATSPDAANQERTRTTNWRLWRPRSHMPQMLHP